MKRKFVGAPTHGIAIAWGALLGAVLLWQTFVQASRPGGIDLTSYLLSARALSHGASPYLLATPFPYLYPSTLAFLLIPLAWVPSLMALVIWFALNASAALWAVRRVVVSVHPDLAHESGRVVVFLALFFTAFLPIVQSNLRNGQVNFVVLALCVAAALPARPVLPDPHEPPAPSSSPAPPDPPGPTALMWALAITIKILPLVLLPYFALRRRWPWMIQAAVACAALLLLPAVVAGRGIVDIYSQYFDVLRASSFAPRMEPLDFSLAGTISAIAGAPATAPLRLSAAAVVFGWILQADARRLRPERARPLALYLLGIPLAMPKSEVHHLAFVLPAAALIAVEWWRPSKPASRACRIGRTIAAALYVAATATPVAKGTLYCAAFIAAGAALMQSGDKEELR